MAFLDDELMIFKDGSRYIYESADVMNATSPEIREEFAGSDFSILGAASIKRGGLYDHIKSNAPAANLLVVSGAFDTDYNVNWTYVSASILAFPDGMRVLDDVDGTVRFVDMPLKQTQSMSFKDGMMSMKAEEYRDFLKSLGMPSIYKTDKDVTFITKNG